MSYFVIEDFKSGLDSRRMTVSSVPGSLVTLTNAHITRGGEIEKRPSFVEVCPLPSDTFGLASVGNELFTFGSVASVVFDADAPSNLTYQQLSHPTGESMSDVLHVAGFSGRPYVIAQYEDGSVWHFYDGAIISSWEDGRARAEFTVTGGTSGGIAATASFTVTGGINSPGDLVNQIRLGTIPLLSSSVQHNGNNTSTATALANAINSFTGNPDFTASAAGDVVTITAALPGTQYNGLVLSITTAGSFTVGSLVDMAGGVDNAVSIITVDGVRITGEPILHTGDNVETAAAIAATINDYPSAPDYFATAIGSTVNIVSVAGGTTPNGYLVNIINTGDVTTNVTSATLAGGAATASTYIPGEYAKPAKSKMYSTTGASLHFSKIDDPTNITDSVNGAGFINLSNNALGSENLTSLANYQQNIAIFSERTVQIWFIDVDSALNQQLQVLNNTGTVSPKSVMEFGDSDVFYLSESGIRSLRARDASNAAFTSDVGNAIDPLIINELRNNRLAAKRAVAVLEPRDGRYLLAIGEKIYVFSYFPASKVSAWSIYEPGFEVQNWAIIGRNLFCRSGDTLYLFGGTNGDTFDNCTVTVTTPFLDGRSPASFKSFTGVDVACEGIWATSVATDPNDIDDMQLIGTISGTTYALQRVTLQEMSTHLAFKLVNTSSGSAKIGSLVLHYEGGDVG